MNAVDAITGTPYEGYAYAYPHKLAYRALGPVELGNVWAAEDRSRLFLYIHIPFCDVRCGFCNLLTTAHAPETIRSTYLQVLAEQADVVQEALSAATVGVGAIGGGTPSILDRYEIDQLFAVVHRMTGGLTIPLSFEFSPGTVTFAKARQLREYGVHRASMGIQSFIEAEAKALGRPQNTATVYTAVERLKAAGFPVLNLDLIYGAAGQTAESWRVSLRETVAMAPEEIYLYPLYVRPLTGLGRRGREWDDQRLKLYRVGRDFLQEHGFEQVSMRYFRRRSDRADNLDGLAYCCQEDGMIGLGAGARSYTRAIHYCTEYGVGRASVRAIINEFARRRPDAHRRIDYGFCLDQDEEQRRYLIKSLLRAAGLDMTVFVRRFGTGPLAAYPQLAAWVEHGLLRRQGQYLCPTSAGLERSDAIGPALYSEAVRQRMATYELT